MKVSPFTEFFHLLFPNLCMVCSGNLFRNEEHICLSCLQAIPRTNYHLALDNPVEKRFWGKVPVERATSFFFFTKGSPFQKVLHALKYKGHQEIGEVMGRYAAADLLESGIFVEVDVIVPVPLHSSKYRQRGYNQSDCIAAGLSKVLEKPVDVHSLHRVRENSTQTKKSVFERYENTAGIFELVDKEAFQGKHVLLVDDVLTTGSTLEACIAVLFEAEGVKVSVFTLAVA